MLAISLRLFVLSAALFPISASCREAWQDAPAGPAANESSVPQRGSRMDSSSPPAAVQPSGDGDANLPPEGGASNKPAATAGGVSPVAKSLLPKSTAIGAPSEGVDWTGLLRASGRFLAMEQSFRLLTEPGTREGLKGSFIHNYARAVGGLHGWADGDEFYVNYVGHPMQGSVAGFLWVGSDVHYRHAQFGRSPVYWKSRLRAAGFAWFYSTQFEIGAISEASIGAIQATPPQQGFVDHVITPTIGMGWMIAEDILDQYLVKRIEAATSNRWIRLLARSGMNPSRTASNVLRGAAPWHRDTREGISSYQPASRGASTLSSEAPGLPDSPGPAPVELNFGFHAERMYGPNKPLSCIGGGGTAAFRVAAAWQMVVDVGGCNLFGLDRNVSGDSLVYMAGPRQVHSIGSGWSTHWEFLIGGQKLTEERMYPERKELLAQLAVRNRALPPTHDQYTEHTESSGVAIATSGGVDYKLTRALAVRVAELSYRHSWAGPLGGKTYSDTLRLVTGLVLRLGTW